MKRHLIPDEFIDLYSLWDHIYTDHLWMQIDRTMYGLPEAGLLSNKLLQTQLARDGYFELPHTLGLWKHVC